ncbi:putative ribonuclease H-like domain-containing protein [Tanacetum coccineum]
MFLQVQKKALVKVTLNASNDEPQPSNDTGKKNDDSEIDNQERPEKSAQDVNTVGPSINTSSTNDNTGSLNINMEEPKKAIQTLNDLSWIEAMQEELLQFKLQQVWTLVDLPYGKRALEQNGIEAIRLFLAYASFKDFVVYQMDVKSAFLYGKIEEEVYVCQPPGFEDPEFPDKVYKVEKALILVYISTKRPWKAKRTTKISQSSGHIPLVTYETVIKEWEDTMERAVTTNSSLEAEQDSVNPTVYESYIKQFWETPKAKTVNEEHQIQAIVDKKKVIIAEKSARSDLMLEDAEGTELLRLQRGMNLVAALRHLLLIVLPQTKNSTFPVTFLPFVSTVGGVRFKFYIMYSRFVQVFLDKQVEGMTRHKEVYVTPSHTKKVFSNMKRPRKGFSRRVTPLFPTMMTQASEVMGEDSAALFDSHSTPIISQPSSSKPRKKMLRRKLRTLGLKRLRNVGSTSRVESSNDVSLGDQEDAPKQGRKIADLDADAEVTLVDETQEMNDDNLMFDHRCFRRAGKEVAKRKLVKLIQLLLLVKYLLLTKVEATIQML